MQERTKTSFTHRVLVAVGASVLTFGFFLSLPAIQVLAEESDDDLLYLAAVDIEVPPPPPVIEEEPEEEEPEPEAEPEFEQETPELSLDDLSLVLEPGGMGDGWGAAGIELNLGSMLSNDNALMSLFAEADLDQRATPIDQPMPALDAKLRRRLPASVLVLLVVDERGAVEDAKIAKSSDPAFNRIALAAVKRWKFEPGRRAGQPVRSRLRAPLTFGSQ